MTEIQPLPADEQDSLSPDLQPAYSGRWIAMVRKRVVGQGGTPEQARLAARAARFKETPKVIYVPTERPLVFSPTLEQVRQALPGKVPVYLVGGAVRDALLGRLTHDMDFALQGDALHIARRVADRLGGAYFPLDEERDTARIILTGPQGDRQVLDFAALRGPGLESDLRARDFTMNAMAVDIHQPQELLDPLGGLEDLKSNRLRSCSPGALEDDPLRVLRAIRLAAAYHAHILPETRLQMRAAIPHLNRVSPERLRDELFRILSGRDPATCLRAMEMLGLLPYTFPELAHLKGISQSTPHVADVWNHSLDAVRKLEQILDVLGPVYEPDSASSLMLGVLVLRLGRYRQQINTHLEAQLNPIRPLRALLTLATLYHDAGKPQTREVEQSGKVRFFGHAEAGESLVIERARALRLSNIETERLGIVVRHHLRPVLLSQKGEPPTRRAIYRFFRDCGPAGVDICLLSMADVQATYGTTLDIDTWNRLLDVARALLEAWWERPQESVSPITLVNGNDLIEKFDLKPGPQIGHLLEAIREAHAAGQVSTREEALNLAREILENGHR